MEKSLLIKSGAAWMFLLLGIIGFACSHKTETQSVNSSRPPEKIVDATKEIAGYKNWTKINKTPRMIASEVAIMCARPSQVQLDMDAKNPHNEKFITVYVNDIGKEEMLTKNHPKFPVGTVIVKEKLTTAESNTPELLTVMIKRDKDYNREVGDWEFLTFNGTATETTARGKLQNCQTCHLVEQPTDYVSRRGYLPNEIRQKLK